MEDFIFQKSSFQVKKKGLENSNHLKYIIFWYLVCSLFFNQDTVVYIINKIQLSAKILVVFAVTCLCIYISAVYSGTISLMRTLWLNNKS